MITRKKRILSKEHKRKIGEANKISQLGKKLSNKTKKKLSKILTGMVRTKETKKRMSKASKKRFKNKKNHPKYGTHHSLETKKKLSNKKKGSKNPNWIGGRVYHKGYVYLLKPHHPNSDKRGYVAEHRYVMEKYLGRYLTSKEVVHHINEIRDDNRIKNLKLFPSLGKHISFHFKGKKRGERI